MQWETIMYYLIFIEDALRAKYRRPRVMGPAFACLVEKLQKIAQESKQAQRREARSQNLAEEGNLEAKMQIKIN